MLENIAEIKKLISSLIRYFDSLRRLEITEILTHSQVSTECIDYDNWNGGTYTYGLYFELEIELFTRHHSLIADYEQGILEAIGVFLRGEANERFGQVIIRPIRKQYLNWPALEGKADKKVVLLAIDQIKNIMIDVSTGGPRIQDANPDYIQLYNTLAEWLTALGLENPNPHKNLWDWYGRWSQEDLRSYASRRTHIPALYSEVIEIIGKSTPDGNGTEYEPTGWERVDRTIYEMRKRLAEAATEEQFQTIGMLGREAIITIAQQVYDTERHQTDDGVIPSATDAKRMLDVYFGYELSGATNERIRKYSKAALDLANNLTHDRLATERDAALCLSAVTSLANSVKIIDRHSELLY